MRKHSRPIKRTKEELADSIQREGTILNIDRNVKYYSAYGQLWRLTYTYTGRVNSIEQVNEIYERINI